MSNAERTPEQVAGGGQFDPDKDRFPALDSVLAAIGDAEDYPDGPVERIEILCHASGDATWRVWTPRADEPEGGYIAPEVLSPRSADDV